MKGNASPTQIVPEDVEANTAAQDVESRPSQLRAVLKGNVSPRQVVPEDIETNTAAQDAQNRPSGWRGLSSTRKNVLVATVIVSVVCAVAIPKALLLSDSVSSDSVGDVGSTEGSEDSGGDRVSLALEPSTGCNRFDHLCSKRFDEITQAALHNAFATESSGFSRFLSNQHESFSSGLLAGARTLMLDVHLVDAETIKVCHGNCELGSLEVIPMLDTIAEFLELNAREIVTIIWETQVATEAAGIETLKQLLTEAAQASRLAPFLTVNFKPGDTWPMLEEMIEANQRLVWFNDRKEGTIADWDLGMWDFVVDTSYSNSARSDLEAPCSFNRGQPAGNKLFLLNHFLSPPSLASAETVNYNPFLRDRAQRCSQELGKHPNFIAVDFHSFSDIFEVVNTLNAETVST